jgi:hypothetical protein
VPFAAQPASRRATGALAVAFVLGTAAAVAAWVVMSTIGFGCVAETGPEAAPGQITCRDGKYYGAFALCAAMAAAVPWLLGYVGWELRRARADELRSLADVAVVVGALALALPAQLLLVGRVWLAVPFVAVPVVVLLARRRPLVVALGVVVCAAAVGRVVILLPFAGGAALAWTAALLLMGVAARRTPVTSPSSTRPVGTA